MHLPKNVSKKSKEINIEFVSDEVKTKTGRSLSIEKICI